MTERPSSTHMDETAAIAPFTFEDLSGAPLRWDGPVGGLTTKSSAPAPTALFIHVFQPDCGKCDELARALEPIVTAHPSAAAVAIAHRLGESEARAFVDKTGITYPVSVGTGSDWTRRWGRGDPLYVVDQQGRIVYRQVGFRDDDPERWQAVIEELVQGRQVLFAGAARKTLEAGDSLPPIELPDLLTGRLLSLSGEGGRLEFVDADGRVHRYRASLGFFSRYWSFSVEEMGHLQRFHEEHESDGLFVYAISMHPEVETPKRMTRAMGITYPVFDGNGSDIGERYAYG